jgi:FkbM family methyltransferase
LYEEIFSINSYNYKNGELEGKVVVDIGANAGFFSIFAAYHGAKTIYAYEPNKENFKKLVEFTKDFPNIIPINKAVHSPDVKKCYTIMDGVICQVRNDGKKEDSVDCVSLEKIANEIDSDFILKIDCEGGEYDILLPCTEEVLKRIKIIYGEFHNNMHPNTEFNIEVIKDFLIKNRFELDIKEGIEYTPGIWYNDDTFIPSDSINGVWKFICGKSIDKF